jgi:hypothetical protein
MKDELERLILNNQASFQESEPPEGHFDRFEAKLKASKHTRKINFQSLLKIAAMVIFVLLAVNQARIYFFPDEKQAALSLGSISPQYSEVEFFYTNAIQMGMKQWEKLKYEGLISESEQKMMQKEQEDFDLMYQKLLIDLKANPDDERVINAMLEYYQSRMNVITLIIDKLQEVKQQKYQNHETEI